MRTLYHLWLEADSRATRLILAEKGLPFDMVVEKTWDHRPEFLELNPAGDVPVLVDEDKTVISGLYPFMEYMEEKYPTPQLLGHTPIEKLETRRLVHWFSRKFRDEVGQLLIGEKVNKRFFGLGAPSSAAIRAGGHNIHLHLQYVSYLVERRRFLAGEVLSLADLMAAAAFSCVDYLGDVPWGDYPEAKAWYTKLKSRPSFRPLLGDHLPGMPPPGHYADLDF